MEVTIESVSLEQLKPLQQIGIDTFAETFGVYNSDTDLDNYLNESFSLEKLLQELNNPDSSFYFAKIGGEIVGYIKLNVGAAQTEQVLNNSLEIERIYVLKEYHRLHIGSYLYAKARQIAEEMEASFIWLGVWEKNKKAIRFYEKLGFEVFSNHIFKLGGDEQTDLLMRLSL